MAILVILAAFSSFMLTKLKLPSLVGFLIAGIIIANYLELPEGTEDIVSMFSDLGLVMLMFSIGMEIDITKLKIQGKFGIVIAIVQVPVMLFAGIIAGSALGYDSLQSLTFGAILAGASTAVVTAVLKTNNVLEQDKVEILIIVMIIEDISQVIMISILTPMMGGSNMSTDDLIVLILSIAIFMIASFTLGLKIVPKVINWFYDRSNDELISLLCMGLLFAFALLASQIGLSVAIGAFLTGVMVGLSRPKHVVEQYVDPLKSLFMAMFFISVGMEVTVNSLVENVPTIILFYALFAICMFLAVNAGYWFASGDPRNGWISAVSMCTMGEFAFIISKLALDYNVFDQSFYSSIIGAAILSMIMLPVLVSTSGKTYDKLYSLSPGFIRKTGGFVTEERDMMTKGLSVVSHRTKERFARRATSSAFLFMVVLIIEIVFFFVYTPLSEWLTKNFGADEYTWRLVILFVNIVVLLEPCRRIANFLRFAVYLIERGKDHEEGIPHREGRSQKVTEYFSTLAVGAAITVTIVILVPNGLSNIVHIFVLLLALAFIVTFQYYRFKKGMEEAIQPTEPSVPDEQKTE